MWLIIENGVIFMDAMPSSFSSSRFTEEEHFFLNQNFTTYEVTTKSFHPITPDLLERRLIVIAGLDNCLLMDKLQDTLLKILIVDPSKTCLFLERLPINEKIQAKDLTQFPSLPPDTSVDSTGFLPVKNLQDYQTFSCLKNKKMKKEKLLKEKWEAETEAFARMIEEKIESAQAGFSRRNILFIEKRVLDEWKIRDKEFYLASLLGKIQATSFSINSLYEEEEVQSKHVALSQSNENLSQLIEKKLSLFSKIITIQSFEHLMLDGFFYERLQQLSIDFTVLFPNKTYFKEQKNLQIREVKKKEIVMAVNDPSYSGKFHIFKWPFPKTFSHFFSQKINKVLINQQKIEKLKRESFFSSIIQTGSFTFSNHVVFQFIDFPLINVSMIHSILQAPKSRLFRRKELLIREFFWELNKYFLFENKQIYLPKMPSFSLFLDFKNFVPFVSLRFDDDFEVRITEEVLLTSGLELIERMQQERKNSFKILPHQKLILKNILTTEAREIDLDPINNLPQFLARQSKTPISVHIEGEFRVFYSKDPLHLKICIYSEEGFTILIT